jgi:hypothetical protein
MAKLGFRCPGRPVAEGGDLLLDPAWRESTDDHLRRRVDVYQAQLFEWQRRTVESAEIDFAKRG